MTAPLVMRDLQRLERLYAAGFHDAFLDNALRKAIEHQIARHEADLKRVEEVVAQFERQYGLSTDEFGRQYEAGQVADTADFMEWNTFRKMRQRLTARLQILRGETAHG